MTSMRCSKKELQATLSCRASGADSSLDNICFNELKYLEAQIIEAFMGTTSTYLHFQKPIRSQQCFCY